MKEYVVIERFKADCFDVVYERFNSKGRMFPEGLHYLNSWVNEEQSICFQLMETNEPKLFDTWIAQWKDLTEFEVVPIN